MREPSPPQRGSALILVVLVSLMVTTLALPLIFVTEIEMLLGGSEKTITNNFYAAESGVHAGLAALVVTQDWGGESFAVVEAPLGSDHLLGHRVVTSRVQGVGPPQVPPLSIANVGETDFHTFSVVMASVAQRVSWPDGDPEHPTPPIYEDDDPRESEVVVQAQASHTVHFLLSPIRSPASAREIYNQEEAHKIGW